MRLFGRHIFEFSKIYMHKFLKYFAFSFKSSSIRAPFAPPLPSSVLTVAQMQRLVADMVD